MADPRTELIKAKRKLETDLQNLQQSFEWEKGLRVNEVEFIASNVAGNSSPAFSRLQTSVHRTPVRPASPCESAILRGPLPA